MSAFFVFFIELTGILAKDVENPGAPIAVAGWIMPIISENPGVFLTIFPSNTWCDIVFVVHNPIGGVEHSRRHVNSWAVGSTGPALF
jgi:hypothetical protein